MGKANRRRTSRGAATEQTQQSQATQGARQSAARPAPLPTDPGKAPEDCTYFRYRWWTERKHGTIRGTGETISRDAVPWIGASCLCARFLSPTEGFAMFGVAVLRQIIETFFPSLFYKLWDTEPYNFPWRVQRWEDYDHGKKARLPFWRAYHRERGHEKELKLMEKLERRTCDVCGLVGAANGPRFGVCDLCGEQRYCSILCQRTDWQIFDHSKKCIGVAK